MVNITGQAMSSIGWAVLGAHVENKFYAIASRSVHTLNIEMKQDIIRRWHDEYGLPLTFARQDPFGSPRTTLTLDFGEFVIAVGDSYGEALSKLFGMWSPDDSVAIGAPTLELGQ